MTFADAKQRFSSRVADYVRYRPGYPSEVLPLLRTECGLKPGHVVADIGSGTGFLSELFLKNGNRVYGIEPNDAMREAGEEYLASYDNFSSIVGSAEATTLESGSVDFVSAGQAFHWFAPSATRTEFRRVLKANGWIVILWNDRQRDTPFADAYENLLLKYGRITDAFAKPIRKPASCRNFSGRSRFRRRFCPTSKSSIGRAWSADCAAAPTLRRKATRIMRQCSRTSNNSFAPTKRMAAFACSMPRMPTMATWRIRADG